MPEGFGIIIPRRAVKALIDSLDAKSSETVTIGMSESRIRFTWARMEIGSKLVDGSYPDYRRVIPRDDFEQTVTCTSADLLKAATTITKATREKSNPVKVTSNGALTLSSANASVTVPCDSTIDGHECGYQAGYLRDLASVMSGTVTMRLHKGAPALITDSAGHTTCVLMPMRI